MLVDYQSMLEIVEKEVQEDEKLKNIFDRLVQDLECVPRYSIQQGKLFFKGWLVLPRTSSLIPTMLHTFHDSMIEGHSGQLRMYKRVDAGYSGREWRMTSNSMFISAQFANKTEYKPYL